MFDWTILKFQRTAGNGAADRPIPVERPLAQVRGSWLGYCRGVVDGLRLGR